jgi:hypothetical protein
MARFSSVMRALMSRLFRRDQPVDFGCDFCADDQNRWFGHLPQVATNEETGLILIRCPRCGWLYEDAAGGDDQTQHLTAAEARERFPGWSPTG